MFTKFDDSSFSRSRDMIETPQLKMGHMGRWMPIAGWFVVRGLGLAIVNVTTKFAFSIFTGNAKCRPWDGLGIHGDHSRSVETAPISAYDTSCYRRVRWL